MLSQIDLVTSGVRGDKSEWETRTQVSSGRFRKTTWDNGIVLKEIEISDQVNQWSVDAS